MYSCPLCVNKAIPEEYRKIAEELFPPEGFAPGAGPTLRAATAFAEALGIGADYKRLLSLKKDSGDLRAFLGHFQNNLDLLIQKTWVEKADETRKGKLQDRVPGFIILIEEERYQEALEEFGSILEELAYLFFGAQSAQDDFTEYALRIDLQMGLFWWYGGQLSRLARSADIESFRAVLMIGLCYLTNF
jgi:hypothetical protein